MPQRFSATIYKLGINLCVDAPKRVSDAFKTRGYVPVAGTLNGHAIRATLVPKGGGEHRLFLNGEMRKRAEVGVGDTVTISLTLDTEPRETPLPDELAEALRENDLLEAFNRLTPSDRRIVLTWLSDARKEETRNRRIDLLVRRLMGRR
jgi:Bacteriocin-protection, YdeI or OmpD-Associated/Domain of unknown function (DUF1905)